MSKKSDAVKKWRKSMKRRVLKAFGDSCCICGYDKCDGAMDLHHLDPEGKDFGLGRIVASPQSWEKIIIELRKCVLVCARCHREIHHGASVVPKNAHRFNEDYADYKQLEREKKMDDCPVCGNKKWIINKSCSLQCSGVLARKIDWDNIDLIEMKKTLTFVAIADILDISDSAVRKRWKKIHNIEEM